MNVRLLRKIQKHILAEPKRFIMGAFVERKGYDGDVVYEDEFLVAGAKREWPFPKCNTAACIGGWAVLLDNPASRMRSTERIAAKAAGLLGIKGYRDRLFNVSHWPSQFAIAFREGKTPAARASAAARRIDHFIATRGQE